MRVEFLNSYTDRSGKQFPKGAMEELNDEMATALLEFGIVKQVATERRRRKPKAMTSPPADKMVANPIKAK